MSRIDEAWKRMTGVAAEPRAHSYLERFVLERAPKPDESEQLSSVDEGKVSRFGEGKVSNFVAVGPRPVESKPSALPGPEVSPTSAPDQAEPDVANEKLIDFRQVGNYLGFLTRSLSRHKALAASTVLATLALTAAALAVMPKTYHAHMRLFAQRNAVMAALSNPGRSVPWDADAPTRAAAETILRRDNLISLVKETDLVADWERTRAPALKAKDALMGFVFRRQPMTADDRLDQMVDLLTKNMYVIAGPVGDGTVTIDLDWPDAQMAYRLVQSAEQAFLVARQAAETAAINESIGILENYSTTLHSNIDRTAEELRRTKAARRLTARTRKVATKARLKGAPLLTTVLPLSTVLPPLPEAARAVPGLGAELDDPELPRLKAAVGLKRQELAKLEEARQQQLSELQTRLGQLLALYTPKHPSVLTVQHSVATLSEPSPQMAELKMAVDKLEAEYQTRVAAVAELEQAEQRKAESAREAASILDPALPVEDARAATPEEPIDATDDGDEADFNTIRLRLELNQIMNVLERTDSAKIELAVSQKAFKYRYTVITPAQVPKSPIRPSPIMVLGSGLIASLIFAFAAVVGKDVMSNRILEPWQIERQLGLPVLGTPVTC